MSPEKDEQQQLRDVLLENQRLLTENNQLLRQMKRTAWWGFWLRIASFLLLIGAPFVLYYWLLQPYFESLGSSFQVFVNGMQEIPGWKQFYQAATDFKGE
ncbi:hypothetical protein KC887_03135 [Candidatus Kaiserbacteria bacterium]|nr:hypothetical protein [Candidatus Kaiserbacteria bacterium]